MIKKWTMIGILVLGTALSVADIVRAIKEWKMARARTKQLQEELMIKKQDLEATKKYFDDLMRKEEEEFNKLQELIEMWKELPKDGVEMTIENEKELRKVLRQTMKMLGQNDPWQGEDLGEFMSNPNNRLKFDIKFE